MPSKTEKAIFNLFILETMYLDIKIVFIPIIITKQAPVSGRMPVLFCAIFLQTL